MINFFRKIRKQLAEDNKPLKYMRYAVGEIVLVVIGILIALSINNWNEERKMEVKIHTHIQSLKADLIKDTIGLNSTLNEMKLELNNLLEISNKLSKKSLSADSIIHIYREEFNPLFDASSDDFNRSTIEGLLSTGNINLFEKNLYNSLLKLNTLQEKTEQLVNVNIEFYRTFSTKMDAPFNDKLMAIEGETLEQFWQSINRHEFVQGFLVKLSSKILGYKNLIDAREELVNQTTLTLDLLSTGYD